MLTIMSLSGALMHCPRALSPMGVQPLQSGGIHRSWVCCYTPQPCRPVVIITDNVDTPQSVCSVGPLLGHLIHSLPSNHNHKTPRACQEGIPSFTTLLTSSPIMPTPCPHGALVPRLCRGDIVVCCKHLSSPVPPHYHHTTPYTTHVIPLSPHMSPTCPPHTPTYS
jgi:hypothetical protein